MKPMPCWTPGSPRKKIVHTWSADFVQTRALKTLTQPLVASGHISFAMPNDFRWELGQPAQTIALRHGDEMFVIYPRLKRAERYPLGAGTPAEWRDTMSLLQAGFPHDRKEFEAQFQILSLDGNQRRVATLPPAEKRLRAADDAGTAPRPGDE